MQRFSVPGVKRLAAVAVCCVALLGMSRLSTAMADPTYELNIPAQDLGSALQAFGAAVNEQVIFSRDVVEGLRSSAVRGQFTSKAAIQLLLKDLGVQVDRSSTGVLLIHRPSSGHTVATPASDIHSTEKERRAGFPTPFRLAQSDRAAPASSAPPEMSGATASTTGSGADLQEIVVGGYRFLDEDTSGITNLPLPIEKVPQSISLVNNDFAEAADLKTLSDIAQYTVGALWSSYIPSYGTEILLRGLNAGYAIDGLTVGDQLAEPDAAILERYEIVKGPASVVYGAESPGGVVNLVSKSASPNTPDYLEALGGSWGRWRLEGQAAGSLNEAGTLRGIAVAVHDEGGSFVDFVKLNKSVAYGGLDFELADGLTGFARASYQRTENTPYNGLPTYADGSLPPFRYAFFIGGADFRTVGQASRIDSGLTWKPSDSWTLDLKAIYQYTTHSGQNVYTAGYVSDGDISVSGETFNRWHVSDFTIAAAAMRKLDDLGLTDSSLSASLRYQHYRYTILESFLSGTADVDDDDGAISHYFETGLTPGGSYQQDQKMKYLTASTQAVVKVAGPLTLVGGVSYSKPWIDYQTYSGPWQNLSPDGQIDYRAALILEPVAGLNLYASYSESYQPNLRLDVNDQVLQPLSGKQYEVGAKYISVGRRLLLTAACFDLRESNVPEYATTVNNEALYKVAGVRHRGLELEATGQLADRWQIKGGVSLLDPKVTADPAYPVNVGETRPWLPRTTANLYTRYDLWEGLSVSGGARFVGSSKTYDNSSAPTPGLPSYTLVDAAVGYAIARWRLQLNLKNVFDKHYYIAPWDTFAYGLYPGEPRSFALSARRDF